MAHEAFDLHLGSLRADGTGVEHHWNSFSLGSHGRRFVLRTGDFCWFPFDFCGFLMDVLTWLFEQNG